MPQLTAFQEPQIHSFPYAILQKLCEEYPGISVDKEIFSGVPHLKGVRLTVAQILSQLYVRGSIEAIVSYYSGEVSADQIKEAIAFAHDYMELTCDPPQIDG